MWKNVGQHQCNMGTTENMETCSSVHAEREDWATCLPPASRPPHKEFNLNGNAPFFMMFQWLKKALLIRCQLHHIPGVCLHSSPLHPSLPLCYHVFLLLLPSLPLPTPILNHLSLSLWSLHSIAALKKGEGGGGHLEAHRRETGGGCGPFDQRRSQH